MTVKCEFCDKPLEPLTVELKDRQFIIGYRECRCSKSIQAEKDLKEAEDKRQTKLEIDRLVAAFEASGIPNRYRGCEKLVENLSELYETAFKDGLYLWGTTGTGKTTIAAAIGIRALKSGRSVLFVNAYNIPQMLFDGKGEEITRPDLLIIDDLGAEASGEWNNARMRSAINDRYNSKKPTIVTSNYSKKELAKLLTTDSMNMTAQAIFSRLSEMTKSLEIQGKDYRNVSANR